MYAAKTTTTTTTKTDIIRFFFVARQIQGSIVEVLELLERR